MSVSNSEFKDSLAQVKQVCTIELQHFNYSENDDLSKEEKRELKRQVRPMARGIFLRMDKNRDGTITLGTFYQSQLFNFFSIFTIRGQVDNCPRILNAQNR